MVDSAIHWLFVDLNSYFASIEQELCPELRGQPIACLKIKMVYHFRSRRAVLRYHHGCVTQPYGGLEWRKTKKMCTVCHRTSRKYLAALLWAKTSPRLWFWK